MTSPALKGLALEIDDEITADDNDKEVLQEIVNNTKLSEGYLTLARDIEVMEPKSPEDIYKVHLIDGRGASSSLDSARQNLAATFVNAFVNAGFGQDKLMTAPSDSSSSGSSGNWLFKNKEHGKSSAAASLENVEATAEVSKTFDEKIGKYCDVTLMSLAHAGTGNVLKVQKLLGICSQHLDKGETHQGPAVLGIALIAMAEELGAEMAVRSLERLLQYGEQNIRRAVPLALGILCISNPKVNVMDTLSRLSHDADADVSMAAIISLGLIGAGTNNARIAGMLRSLSSYYYKEAAHLFCVRIAQGLVHLGKGLLTLSPYHSDRFLLSPMALGGLVTVLHACLDMKSTILGKYHYILYIIVLAMQPRMLLTVDEDLKPLSVPVRVGQAVDVVGQAGRPKTITGFQTHSTPVLLAAGERAELATEKYIPVTPVLEGFVILKKNPEYHEE
ncbi:hypothetical protein PR202_gb06217 [Eleusine coracana subsp. coracana]|uniref:26S proteasome non-ATPase regulatory subunit 2 homolog n=1 Tax=Eleusine coracana subsp. coracana TaxID=191504 RepID=A0AAV5E9W7_ELECO|nr:hypothetical protein PR202_gb06217 [Eleusine coracana subsp. coracana]